MSSVINFILFVVCNFSSSWATCCEFSTMYMCYKLCFFNLLFIKRAILYDGACMLFVRWGLYVVCMIGPVRCLYDGACMLFIWWGLYVVYYWSYGLIIFVCFFKYSLSCGAFGFMFIRYLWICLSISILLFWMVCWICLWYISVGSLFSNFMLFSLMKLFTFSSNFSLSMVTTAFDLSAFTSVRLLFSSILFIWLMLYCWGLWWVLCLLEFSICLICLAARCHMCFAFLGLVGISLPLYLLLVH